MKQSTSRSTTRRRTFFILFAVLGASACEFEIVNPVELPFVEKARSVIIGAESGDEVQVVALDLPPVTEVDLPHLYGDESAFMRVAARFYSENLDALNITPGRLVSNPTAEAVPERAREIDYSREFYADIDTGWLSDAFGLPLSSFRSDGLPPPNHCGRFEAGAVHQLDDPDLVLKAVPLGIDALVLQRGGRLYRASTARISRLTEVETAISSLGLPVVTIARGPGGALISSCAGETISILQLSSLEVLKTRSVDGLPGCPSELSAFGDQLFALVGGREVFTQGSTSEPWTRFGSFSRPVEDTARSIGVPFIATGRDEVVGINVDTTSPVATLYYGLTLGPAGENAVELPTPPTAALEVARPATMDGYVGLVLGSAVEGARFLLRAPTGEWSLVSEFNNQAVLALAPSEGGFVVTGRYGFVLELRPFEALGPEVCTYEAAVVPGSNATELVPIGFGEFLLAGNSNRERPLPWTDKQEVQVVSLH